MRTTPVARLFFVLAGFVIVIALLFSAGCAAPAQATPTPTKTPRPVDTQAPPAATQAPTATLPPTPTAVPATETPVVAATVAPTEAATEAPAAPAATDPPAGQPGGGSSAVMPTRQAGVSIFTGVRPADPAVLNRRPLAVKVTNDADAQPKQAGLNKADVVVESRVEYSETRLTAIYQSQDAPRIGPIRSARLIDVELPAIFDAVLAFSGGVEPVRQLLYNSDFGDHLLEQARNGSSFYRDMSVGGLSWNTLFADTATLWNTSTQRGWNTAPEPSAAWAFSEGAAAGGAPASRIDLSYPRFKVGWAFDAGTGRWLRSSGGTPLMDRADGQQVSAANVVVLGANHVITLIVENGTERQFANGVCINCSIEIQLWGEGPVKVLRDGQVYEGKWLRAGRHAPFRFVDAQGRDIPLKPGNSWWQVAPLDLKVTVTP